MNIKLLRAFVTLARQGKYHLAADQLCITQPALTKQIQAIESISGLTLFQRGRHGAKLTIAGEQLMHKADEVLMSYDNFCSAMIDIQKGNTGKIKVGFGISSFSLAPEHVAVFHSLFPSIQVSLNDMPTAVQLQLLIEGKLHAGFVRLPVNDQLESKALAEEKLVLAIALKHYKKGVNAIELIKTHNLLQLSHHRGEGLTGQGHKFLTANNIIPSAILVANDIQTLLALIAAGEGVALLPQSVIHILPSQVKLVVLEGAHTTWQIGLAWNSKIEDSIRDNFVKTVLLSSVTL